MPRPAKQNRKRRVSNASLDLLFEMIVRCCLISFVLLGCCVLALRVFRRPAERIRLIQIALLAIVLSAIGCGVISRPMIELAWLPAVDSNVETIAKVKPIGFRGLSANHVVEESKSPDTTKVPFGVGADLAKSNPSTTGKVIHSSGISNEVPKKLGSWVYFKCIFIAILLAGAMLQATYLLLGFILARRLVASSLPLSASFASRAKAMIGGFDNAAAPNRIVVASSDRIDVPIVCGILRPTILLPADMIGKTDDTLELKHSLAHEFKHVQQGDLMTWQLVSFAQTFLWMQPLYWILRRELRVSQDLIADDFAVSVTNQHAAYAAKLLDLSRNARTVFPGALTMAGTKSNLYRRIEMLLNKNKRPMGLSRKRVLVAFGCVILMTGLLLASLQITHAAKPRIVDPDGSLTVSVVDSEGTPVQGAELEIKNWGASWEGTKYVGTSNEKGEVVFEEFVAGYYPAVLVRHPDFAPILQNFSFEEGAGQQSDMQASQGRNWITKDSLARESTDCRRDDTRLTVSSAISGNKMALRHDDFEMLTSRPMQEFVSDESGNIELPPLPAGSSVIAVVLHPHWKSATVEEANINELKSTAVVMSPGTIVTAKFAADDSVLKELEGKAVQVSLFTGSLTDSASKYSIMHRFPVSNGAIEFCLAHGQYDGFSLSVDGFLITPSFPSTLRKFEFTNIPDAGRINKTFVVQKPVPAKGRVITESGEPIANATVMIGSQNLWVDDNQELARVPEFEFKSNFAESDEDGYYDVKIPPGPTNLSVQWSGYYCEDDRLKADFQPGHALPDLVLKPLPLIEGKVVDANGHYLVGAIVRVSNRFGETKYVQTDKDGKFELKIEHFEYDYATKKRLNVIKVIGFEPHSTLANIVEVDLSEKSKFSNVTLKLVDHEPGWLAEELGRMIKESSEQIFEQMETDLEKITSANEKKFPDAKLGNPAPEIVNGTWFNSEFASLKEFRGQFVLLDFWFIGCGPCERDFPTVKLANDIFGEYGFFRDQHPYRRATSRECQTVLRCSWHGYSIGRGVCRRGNIEGIQIVWCAGLSFLYLD